MSYEITGTIVAIEQTAIISATFKKRVFVLQVVNQERPEYSELISLEFIQDKCDILDNYQLNTEVTVGFNLKGRKWTNPQGQDKYFNTLQAWRINQDQGQVAGPPPAPYQQPAPQVAAPVPNFNDDYFNDGVDSGEVPF